MPKIVFVSYGSLGDTLPFVAVAEALRDRGFECAFVGNPRNMGAVEARGFEAHGIVTDPSTLFDQAGYTAQEAVTATRENVDVFWRLTMPEFSSHCAEIEAIARGADAIVGTPWAFNAQSVAEKTGIPFIGAHLWPLGLLSAHDPPVMPQLPLMVKAPQSGAAVWWNGTLVRLAHLKMRLSFSRVLNAARMAYGLPKSRRAPVLDFLTPPVGQMALYSPSFAPRPPDAPPGLTVTGFPMPKRRGGEEDPELAAFLKEAPIVFSLGSILSENPGDFYKDSVAAARALGRRSLVLTPQIEGIPMGPDVLVRAFVPHKDVFPSACVVVHHGGIGTTGQALMAGHPQLVVPHFGDQPDNGARLKRLGVGRVIASTAYNAKTAEVAIGALLASDEMADRAQNLAKTIARENGAQSAADAIMDLIGL